MGEASVAERVDGRSERYFTPSEKSEIVAEICERLALGEPLALMCRDDPRLPGARALWDWERADPEIATAISRARRLGHHVIATQLRATARGELGYSSGDVQRDKLIVDTDLKLLAKWDPKYSDSTQLRHADADGNKLETAPLVGELLGLLGGNAEQLPEPIDVTPRVVQRAETAPVAPAPVAKSAYKPRRKAPAAPPADSVDDLV